MSILLRLASLFLLILALTGCAAAVDRPAVSTSGDPLAAVPEDFTADLRVLTPAQQVGSKDQPIAPPGRFVLLPDGALHAELNGAHRARRLPPFIRRLNARQRAEAWALLSELGYADPQRADAMINPVRIERPGSGAFYVLNLRGGQRQWMFTRRIGDGNGPDSAPGMQRLVDWLIERAWLDGEADGARMIAPRRYDFGPDPYARHRRSAETDSGDAP